MKFSELYDRAISSWPKKIDISDGKPSGKSGYLFPRLVKIHDEIESTISLNDDWMQITDWAIFQAFHSKSETLIKSGKSFLNTRKVKQSEIESRLFENLQGGEWQVEREYYENDI